MNSKIFGSVNGKGEKGKGKRDVDVENESSYWMLLPLIPLAAAAVYQGIKYLKS